MRLNPQSPRDGFAPILIALGVVSVLGVMSLTSSLVAQRLNRRLTDRMGRLEAFYSGELTAWHGHFRKEAGLESQAVALTNTPYVGIENELAPDEFSLGRGTPLNVSVTKKYAATESLIRRYGDRSLRRRLAPRQKIPRVPVGDGPQERLGNIRRMGVGAHFACAAKDDEVGDREARPE